MIIRHIAGIPTPTEQRCVRCCEVISKSKEDAFCRWPGEITECVPDCTPHDPHAIDEDDYELAAARLLKYGAIVWERAR